MTALFNDLAHVYDAMIDWPKRLEHEGHFYRRLFEKYGVHNVVDVACGSGRHAAMFQSWGMQVEAADLSPAMIDRAKTLFGEPPGLTWIVRAFDEPIEAEKKEAFDAAVCVGNSLPLAADMNVVQNAVENMFAAVRPGGIVVIHVLNLRHLPDGPCVWQKSRLASLPEGEVLIIKGVHRHDRRGYVELIVADPSDGRLIQTESSPLLGLDATDLESLAKTAGAAKTHLFGGYSEKTCDPAQSLDIILVAEKSSSTIR